MLAQKVAVNVILVLILSSTGESYWQLKATVDICPDGSICQKRCCVWRTSPTGFGCCNFNAGRCCTGAMDGKCCPHRWRCEPPHSCVRLGNELGRGYRAKDVENKRPENLL
ncbi:uncharacterized protein [Porites lutea]|uniref:uncharacterized protein n=1 Tax=Porites lutea TaxID=51062 RepID=UPI003CC61CB5